jgi:steroid delta-isomerase-like uncharacterized protein
MSAIALGLLLLAPVAVRGEDNKAMVRRYIEEGVNKGNLVVVDELIAADYVGHTPFASELKGPEGVKQDITGSRTAFPDRTLTIEDMIAEGDTVVTRWSSRGTHRGTYRGIAPTGKQVSTVGVSIIRVANGKIQENWEYWDTLSILQQVGAVPPSGQVRQ